MNEMRIRFPIAGIARTRKRSEVSDLPRGVWMDYNDRTMRHVGPTTITARPPIDVLPRYVRAGSIALREEILQSNNNWIPKWAPALRIEFYPRVGTQSRFDYYTGSAIVPMTGTMSDTTVSWQAGDVGMTRFLEGPRHRALHDSEAQQSDVPSRRVSSALSKVGDGHSRSNDEEFPNASTLNPHRSPPNRYRLSIDSITIGIEIADRATCTCCACCLV
jgi:hypothetical protein